jgi:hypothetical protein
MIQYLGFAPKPRGREYSYRVVNPKSEPREFTLTISNQGFLERHVPYQDAAAICYQKLQRELAAETPEQPLRRHLTVSDQELGEFLDKHRPAKRRG